MGEGLLKETGAGNLFTVFGEPDIVVESNDDGEVEVEVRGVDVYNPTTGEIRSDSAENIACWMIDTDYNSESFFVRHAYFSGPKTVNALRTDRTHPYRRLQDALRAEIDEEAWLSLYRTRSRPFSPPTTGQIAVKVINHHGDEVLKTYLIPRG
jgi:adenine-specific DNA-methyltransferase